MKYYVHSLYKGLTKIDKIKLEQYEITSIKYRRPYIFYTKRNM